jgi:hypothetical protein
VGKCVGPLPLFLEKEKNQANFFKGYEGETNSSKIMNLK